MFNFNANTMFNLWACVRYPRLRGDSGSVAQSDFSMYESSASDASSWHHERTARRCVVSRMGREAITLPARVMEKRMSVTTSDSSGIEVRCGFLPARYAAKSTTLARRSPFLYFIVWLALGHHRSAYCAA